MQVLVDVTTVLDVQVVDASDSCVMLCVGCAGSGGCDSCVMLCVGCAGFGGCEQQHWQKVVTGQSWRNSPKPKSPPLAWR